MTDTQLSPASVVGISGSRGRITVETPGDRCTVRLVGEIDADLPMDDVESLAGIVRDAARPVHVDCSAVTFFGAEGLDVLTLLAQAAPGRRLATLATNPVVDLVLDLYPAGTFMRA